jgi:hypothetical protein
MIACWVITNNNKNAGIPEIMPISHTQFEKEKYKKILRI